MHGRSRLATFAASLAFVAGPASAASLIAFTDNGPTSSFTTGLTDEFSNFASSWTQTVATSNVTVRAVLSSLVGPLPANWWITNALGPSTGAANVIATGTYVAPTISDIFDTNAAARTTLATGLNFAPGTYYLVLDGPQGNSSTTALWLGDEESRVTLGLAPGFTLGDYFSAAGGFFPLVTLPSFGPQANFIAVPTRPARPVFELEGDVVNPIPEPATWALMIVGFGLVGSALRRRSRAVAAA